MKKFLLLSIMALCCIPSLVASSYSLVTPSRGQEHVVMINDDGRQISLDDGIYYKRWNGYLLEGYGDGLYTVTDPDGVMVAIFTNAPAMMSNMAVDDFVGRTASKASTIIFAGGGISDLDSLAWSCSGADIVTTSRLSSLDSTRAAALGLEVHEIGAGEAVDVVNGRPVIKPASSLGSIIVICPHCGERFVVAL